MRMSGHEVPKWAKVLNVFSSTGKLNSLTWISHVHTSCKAVKIQKNKREGRRKNMFRF